jgi:hypothetical protein
MNRDGSDVDFLNQLFHRAETKTPYCPLPRFRDHCLTSA